MTIACEECKDWGSTVMDLEQCPNPVTCPKCKRLTFPNLGVNLPAGAAVAFAHGNSIGMLKRLSISGKVEHIEFYLPPSGEGEYSIEYWDPECAKWITLRTGVEDKNLLHLKIFLNNVQDSWNYRVTNREGKVLDF